LKMNINMSYRRQQVLTSLITQPAEVRECIN